MQGFNHFQGDFHTIVIQHKKFFQKRYQELVKDAPNCYFKQVDMEKELNLLWEIAEIKPDMVIDCTRYPKETEALQKACQKKHWEYKRV